MGAMVGEEDLIGRRVALMGLGYPADDWPDDRVIEASGGDRLPTLPGWYRLDLRDWAVLHATYPEAARTILETADRWWDGLGLGKLHRIGAWVNGEGIPPGIAIDMSLEEPRVYCQVATITDKEIRHEVVPVVAYRMESILEEIRRAVPGAWADRD